MNSACRAESASVGTKTRAKRSHEGNTYEWRRKLFFVVMAFLAQGGWALWVNVEVDFSLGLRAGILHGIFCALLTLSSALIMEGIYYRFQRTFLKIIAPIIGASIVTLLISTLLHYLNGTPDIFITLLPLILLGVPYYVLYTLLIWQSESNREKSLEES